MRGIVKRTALLLLMLAGIQTASADYFAGGTGTPEDPYQIKTVAQLQAFGSFCKDHESEWQDTYKSASYKLMNDINMSGKPYFPASVKNADSGVAFTGTFDGNHKTISNLNIERSDISMASLIGWLEGTIKDLTISNSSFKVEKENTNAIVGPFAAVLEYTGKIQNCTTINCTVAALSNYSVNAGGIVGRVFYGGDVTNEISGCWVKGNTSINCNYNSQNKLGAIAGHGGTSGTTWSSNYYEWTIKKNDEYVRNYGNWGNGSMNDVEGQFQVEPVTTWAILKSALTVGGSVKLAANCTDQTKSSSSYLHIPSNTPVTLDLNGYTINRNLSSETTNGYVIKNEGTLTIKDTSNGGTGTITGGYYANGDAAGILNSSTLTIEGGRISGNHGVGISNSSSMFKIHGGTITANTSGGVISSQTFNISGKITITGNTNYNVHLDVSNQRDIRLVLDGSLDSSTRIGITLDGAPERFTSGLSKGAITNFTSDNASYDVGVYSNEAYIKRKINPSISMANWVYDGTCHTPTITVTGNGSQRLYYKKSTASDFSTTQSIDIGTYKVKVIIQESRLDMGGEATSGNYTISKRSITITAKDQEITYGNAIATGTGQITITNGCNEDYISNITIAKTNNSYTDVGTYNTGITASQATIKRILGNVTSTDNYTITYATGKLTINQKDLTVTADNKNITYGDAAPAYTVSYDGFIDGEGAGNLIGTATYACDYQQYSNAGDYAITPSGLTADNYAITFVPGTLTVAPKGVVVTGITASDKVYDGNTTATINSAATFTGKLENDELTLTATGVFNDKNVGTGKDVTVSDHALGGTSAGNYTITSTGTQTSTTANITPKTVGITWGPTILTYNNTAQSPTATATELVGSDVCNVTVTGQQTAVGVYSGANVATANALDNSNYQLPNPKPTIAFEIANPLSMSFAANQLWATWYGAYNYEVPTGMTAYKVSSVSGTTVTVDAIGYVPANTGVLINRTATDAADVNSNIYNGVTGDNTSLLVNGNPTPYTDYILFNDQFVLSSVSTIGEHRCYLPSSGVAGTRGLLIVVGGDDTTDIEQKVIDTIETGEWYDMQGRRIVRPHKKGIYIRDGKKVVIK